MTFPALAPLADRAALFAALRQDQLVTATAALGEHRWDVDLAAGTLTFTSETDPSRQLVARASLVATIAPGPRSLMWAWAHPQGGSDPSVAGLRDYGTWHVRRVAPELPTKCGTVIVANDGHKFIKAEVDGIAHRAREAVLGANGWWYGAWRKAEGDGLLSAMFPEHISAPTWKVDDQ